MKKIITTVGTSLFSNAIRKKIDIKENFFAVEDKSSSDWVNYQIRIKDVKDIILKSDFFKKESASAEIQSILKIVNEIKEDVIIHLIATDTILSRLAAEIIKEFDFTSFQNTYSIEIKLNPETDVIKGLQVKDRKKFEKEGLVNLLNRIEQLSESYWNNIVFNITGGYKALIPYMTILGQIRSVSSYYTFQDDKDLDFELIKIPQLPLSLNEDLFVKFSSDFEKLKKEEIGNSNEYRYEFLNECSSLLEVNDNMIVLNPLGIVLLNKYKSMFFTFYCTDSIWNEIDKQEEIKRILISKFHYKDERISKNKSEEDHKTMFKDGNNPNRIYYFEKGQEVYIYKTFEDHDAHVRFLKTKFDDSIKSEIISKASLRRLKI
jgi:putative CRISPR-associated protein (TIGR02619 family)